MDTPCKKKPVFDFGVLGGVMGPTGGRPCLGSIGVSRVLFLLVACAGVHVHRGASLMIYYYINIIIFIYLSSVVKINIKT